MTVWREVQEALYARWTALWAVAGEPRSPTILANDPPLDPPAGLWAKVEVQRRPGGNGTIGAPGNRKMDRRGVVFIRLRGACDEGSGPVADAAQQAGDVFENCRVLSNGIRFGNVDIGEAAKVDDGRWWGVTVEAPFDYEEIK